MQYKVPQNVQREDRILWFLTFKQFIILLVGGGISYLLFVNLSKNYELNLFDYFLVWLPALLSVAFAFITIKGIALFQFILLMIEYFFFRPPRRYWIQGGGEKFVSLTTNYSPNKKKKPQKIVIKRLDDDHLKDIVGKVDLSASSPNA